MSRYDACEHYSAEEFASWLRDRMVMLQSPDPRERSEALDFFGDVVLEHQVPIDAFVRFGTSISRAAAARFRVALGQVLRQAHPDWIDGTHVSLLVLLVGALHAHEAVNAMISVVAEGDRWGRRRELLFIDVLSVLKGLSITSQADLEAASRVVLSPAFPNHFIFDAFPVLMIAERLKWGQTFARLIPLFEKATPWQPSKRLPSPQSWFDERMQSMVKQNVATMALPTVLAGLLDLLGPDNKTALQRVRPGHPVARLIFFMFAAPDAAFVLWHEEGAPHLSYRGAPEKSVPWPLDLWLLKRFLKGIGVRVELRPENGRPLDAPEGPPKDAALEADVKQMLAMTDHQPTRAEPVS